ncbi:tRNA methyltransferase 10 homolog B-like isoform X3 [Ornithodoros turicata]|uniref:tRNA methyltransferase 10 homolog B-like isoform X3 n=1 Tax=Ornithodoros turicata TaxID=34597 RepID=UPI003138739B
MLAFQSCCTCPQFCTKRVSETNYHSSLFYAGKLMAAADVTLHECDRMATADIISHKAEGIARDSTDWSADAANISRKQLRKQLRYEAIVAARRVKRREKKQNRKKRLVQERLERNEDGDCNRGGQRLSKRLMKGVIEKRLRDARGTAPRVCIDLGMTDLMSDKELNKLSSQLRRLYGSNRHSEKPLHLYFTNFSPSGRLYNMCITKHEGFKDYIIDMTAESHTVLFPRETLLYLSPDASGALNQAPLNLSTVYVIGGLVDETVHKNVSLDRAGEDALTCARLPIEECLQRDSSRTSHSKVLTVNQVFDILLKVYESGGDWENSLLAVLPQRKGFVKKAPKDLTIFERKIPRMS